MRDDYFKKIMRIDGISSMPGSQIKPNRFVKAQKETKTPSVIRPKPTDSSGQPFKPTPMGKKAGGRIGFQKGSGRTGVGAMDVKSKISLAKKKKKNKKSDRVMGKGLYANIHAKRKRGEKMRKKGAKGAPKASDFKRAKQTARA